MGKLSDDIPISYMIGLTFERITERIYGSIRFRTLKSVFVNSSAKIRVLRKFKFRKNLRLARGCYIDALGVEGINCGSGVSFGYKTTKS